MSRGGAGGGAWAPARVRGFQPPYSRDQLAAMILYPILTAGFYAVASIYMPKEHLPAVLVIHAALVVVVVACWIYVEMVDPSKPGGIPCLCMKHTQSSSRYCANCRKSVPGLDHHCLWLNTCIGTRNYFFFFLLSVCGTLQFALQTLVSVLLLTEWLTGPVQAVVKDTLLQLVFFQVIMIVHSVASGAAMLGFGSLCVFHSYLQGLGMGTYDWVLSKRDYGTSPAQTNTNGASSTGANANGARRPTPAVGSGKIEMTSTARRPVAAMGADPEVDLEKGTATRVHEEGEGQVLSMPAKKADLPLQASGQDQVEDHATPPVPVPVAVVAQVQPQGQEAEAARVEEEGKAAPADKAVKAEREEEKQGGRGEEGKEGAEEEGAQGKGEEGKVGEMGKGEEKVHDKAAGEGKTGAEQADVAVTVPGDEVWQDAVVPEERWEDATYHHA